MNSNMDMSVIPLDIVHSLLGPRNYNIEYIILQLATCFLLTEFVV